MGQDHVRRRPLLWRGQNRQFSLLFVTLFHYLSFICILHLYPSSVSLCYHVSMRFQSPDTLRAQMYALTGVPPDRQKIMHKGKTVKVRFKSNYSLFIIICFFSCCHSTITPFARILHDLHWLFWYCVILHDLYGLFWYCVILCTGQWDMGGARGEGGVGVDDDGHRRVPPRAPPRPALHRGSRPRNHNPRLTH